VRASGAAAGVDEGTFADCLADGDGVLDQLAAEGRIAQALGLTGTPSFALGTPIESDRVRVHTLIVGAQSLQIFEEVIKTLR
jgi:predicted DsbA family dithiol-disulfide isomerase